MAVCSTLPDREALPERLHVCVLPVGHDGPHVCESCQQEWEE
jgi:hypothetical protein